ncbi:MAG: hypothetical protein R3233_09865, partial [Xanthomonadales bacterium]|nr:hypothetical protein [Xanthomonadales bacterium]
HHAADRSRFQGFTQLRVLNDKEGWTYLKQSGKAPGELKDWDAARIARGVSEWTGNIEVLTHRMARNDPAVTVRMGEGERQGWLRIEVDGVETSYLLLDENGAPKQFNRLYDDILVTFGPLADRGDFRFPAWGAFEGGEPFEIIAFEMFDSPPKRPFRKPRLSDPGYLDCR